MIINLVIETGSFTLSSYFVRMATDLLEKMLAENSYTSGEVNVVIGDDKMLQELNCRFRNIDLPTDVLSFLYNDKEDNNDQADGFILGDIFISHERAFKQASEAGHSIEKEITFLAVHGMLHLLGHDHHEDQEAEIMEQQEGLIMNYFNKVNGGSNLDE
jgi:probable rRNA maturation factor